MNDYVPKLGHTCTDSTYTIKVYVKKSWFIILWNDVLK